MHFFRFLTQNDTLPNPGICELAYTSPLVFIWYGALICLAQVFVSQVTHLHNTNHMHSKSFILYLQYINFKYLTIFFMKLLTKCFLTIYHSNSQVHSQQLSFLNNYIQIKILMIWKIDNKIMVLKFFLKTKQQTEWECYYPKSF